MSDHLEPELDPGWVDEILLAGPADQPALAFDETISRSVLRSLVAERQAALAGAGIGAGGCVALHLPPSLAFVTSLLATWRLGAQAVLIDHRLTPFEVDSVLARLDPQVVVAPKEAPTKALRGFVEVDPVLTARPGTPAATPHAVIQFSSGSTGPSKVIGRTAANLVAEVHRYTLIDGVPRGGERIVSLASMVHVLGLVGGLMYGLHAGATMVVPARMTTDGILATVAADDRPTTLLGVPFHIELLASVRQPPALPMLTGMTTGGELVRPEVYQAFVDRYGVRLGNMYGMTEVGVIATDLYGENRPAVLPAPGIEVREEAGELLIAMPASPYVGLADPTRWSDGWLHTRDAGSVDPGTGLVRVSGRRDSQISVGGLKVDLTEVEHTLCALPEVAAAVVLFERSIEAFVTLREPATAADVEAELAARLAAYKRPKQLHVIDQLPRTATGKLVRDHSLLRAAAGGAPAAR